MKMRTERKEGRWADGERGERARGRGRGRVTKAGRHVELIPRGHGVGVHLRIEKHLAVSGNRRIKSC